MKVIPFNKIPIDILREMHKSSPFCVNCATAAGNCVETAIGVLPTPGILISAPSG